MMFLAGMNICASSTRSVLLPAVCTWKARSLKSRTESSENTKITWIASFASNLSMRMANVFNLSLVSIEIQCSKSTLTS